MVHGSSSGRSIAGSRVVLAMFVIAMGLACFAVWFQWRQTRRCLAFYGPAAARAIQASDRVELWPLVSDVGPPRHGAPRDISRAPGLVHLRRGLVEDANFSWTTPPAGRLPENAWDWAIAFFKGPSPEPVAVLAFDLDGEGWVTVVGRPGRIGLGRMAPGLRRWISETVGQPNR
jgi:hypothetical protein